VSRINRSSGDEFLRARENQIRLRILVLAATGDLPEKLSASAMKEKLIDDFSDLKAGEVHYHLTRLQDGALLPRPVLPGP